MRREGRGHNTTTGYRGAAPGVEEGAEGASAASGQAMTNHRGFNMWLERNSHRG